MTQAQHRLVTAVEQGFQAARVQSADTAWLWLGIIMLAGIILLGITALWIFSGGLSRHALLSHARDKRSGYL